MWNFLPLHITLTKAPSTLYMKWIGAQPLPKYSLGPAALQVPEVCPGERTVSRSPRPGMASESELAEIIQLGYDM
jgi:hypothetical protein